MTTPSDTWGTGHRWRCEWHVDESGQGIVTAFQPQEVLGQTAGDVSSSTILTWIAQGIITTFTWDLWTKRDWQHQAGLTKIIRFD
jgi:hypothetical protein